MLFRKGKKPPPAVFQDRTGPEAGRRILDLDAPAPAAPAEEGGLRTIEYEMMRKGSRAVRRGAEVRQFLVMVGNTSVLVTSGDRVDQATYEALVAAGVIDPPKA